MWICLLEKRRVANPCTDLNSLNFHHDFIFFYRTRRHLKITFWKLWDHTFLPHRKISLSLSLYHFSFGFPLHPSLPPSLLPSLSLSVLPCLAFVLDNQPRSHKKDFSSADWGYHYEAQMRSRSPSTMFVVQRRVFLHCTVCGAFFFSLISKYEQISPTGYEVGQRS